MPIPANVKTVTISGSLSDLFPDSFTVGGTTAYASKKFKGAKGFIKANHVLSVGKQRLGVAYTDLSFKADGTVVPTRVIATDADVEPLDWSYTIEVRIPDIGTFSRSGVDLLQDTSLKDIFTITSSTGSGSASSKSDVMFEASERYFSPVSYWWADFWNADSNWGKTLAEPDVLGPVLVNIGNGPGESVSADWLTQIKIARAYGAKVFGYVSTAYSKRAVADILSDVAKHVEFYSVDGIFLDETTNGIGANEASVEQYVSLYKTIKSKYGESFWVVANPGTATSEAALDIADTIMVYESDADYYLNPTWDIHPSYYATQPRTKFWHVIHSVRDEAQAKAVLDKVHRKYRPAFVYLTDLRFDNGATNPYAKPASDWLWQLQVEWARHSPEDETTSTPDDTGWVYLNEQIPEIQSGDYLRARRLGELVMFQGYLTAREWPGEFSIPLPEAWHVMETLSAAGVDGGAPIGPVTAFSDRVAIWGAPAGTTLRFGAASFRA